MDLVLTELYDALMDLRYPEIAKIDLKDLSKTVLNGQNRIDLLAWLLSRACPLLSTHLEKLQGANLKDEVVKCFIQMGVAVDENTLLGNSSAKEQVSTLKALLLFTKTLNSTENVAIDDTAIHEVLEKHISRSINIIPSTCHVSMKLTESEAKKYLNDVKMKEQEVFCVSPASELPASGDKIRLDNKSETDNVRIVSLDSVAEAFSGAFESVDSWKNSKSQDLSIRDGFTLDEAIQNSYKNLSLVSQVFKSKTAILATNTPKCMSKIETPLSSLIEDNVIFSEEIKSLYVQADLDI